MRGHTNKGGTAIRRPLHSICAEGVFLIAGAVSVRKAERYGEKHMTVERYEGVTVWNRIENIWEQRP